MNLASIGFTRKTMKGIRIRIRIGVLILGLVTATTLATFSSFADTIAQWTFETDVQTPASVDPNVTHSDFVLSSGSVVFHSGNAPTAVTGISGTGWTASSPNDSDAKWWEFTITANSGYVLDLASLTFDDRASGTGAADWSVAINGVMVVSDEPTHDSFSASPMNTVTLNSYQ
ncbi:MAG TPA: hypothetical protein VKA67_09740, partial [Verrucomicrobiae bacterium]|nr:hypothetical protein [Verrucomicrobiae bacterium]